MSFQHIETDRTQYAELAMMNEQPSAIKYSIKNFIWPPAAALF